MIADIIKKAIAVIQVITEALKLAAEVFKPAAEVLEAANTGKIFGFIGQGGATKLRFKLT